MSTADAFGQPAVQPIQSGRAPIVRAGRYRFWNPDISKYDTWSRVSTFAKAISDTRALQDWLLRQTVIGLGLRTDLHARACAVHPEDRSSLMEIVSQAQEAAKSKEGANRGTALHAFAESADRGEDLSQVPAEWRADVAAYQRSLDGAQLECVPEMMERIVMIPELQLLGKFDRIYRHTPTGDLLIGDLKTTKNIDYTWGEIGIQLGAYAHATYYWDAERDDWLPMPEVRKDLAVVAHVLVGTGQASIIPVDIARGMEGARLAMQVREYRSKSRTLALPLARLTGPVPLHLRTPEDLLGVVRNAPSREHLSALWQELEPYGLWTEALTLAGKTRLAELSGS